jgi:hypothetical protein
MMTPEQAESRLTVVMGTMRTLQEIIQAEISPESIDHHEKLVDAYEREWMPEIRLLVPDWKEQIEKYLNKP